jgi:hypothetical protein
MVAVDRAKRPDPDWAASSARIGSSLPRWSSVLVTQMVVSIPEDCPLPPAEACHRPVAEVAGLIGGRSDPTNTKLGHFDPSIEAAPEQW